MLLNLSQSLAVSVLATILNTSTLNGGQSTPPIINQPIPVLEVIKIYGKLAGPECYGMKAPSGTSCQANLQDVEKKLGLYNNNNGEDNLNLSKEKFLEILNEQEFKWPLKPYGIEKSLTKTVTMNKSAETKVFMDELENRGLYDKRNPTGPLPTSLRPKLNKLLQDEQVDPDASNVVFEKLSGRSDTLKSSQLKGVFSGDDDDNNDNYLDYYGFLELIGKESIKWPY